jgi:hypothetical protein
LINPSSRTQDTTASNIYSPWPEEINRRVSYAIGQQNNHGTSEAAALFIGGSFLAGRDPRAASWARKGWRWLEERAATLIERDGSFSQYSVTYHRVMLDTYALAEAWRRHRDLPAFSDRLQARLSSAPSKPRSSPSVRSPSFRL